VRAFGVESYAGLHARTLNVMLPHHHIDFLRFQQILKSVSLTRDIRAPWRWSEYDRNTLERFYVS